MNDVDVSKIEPRDVVGVRVLRLCDEDTVAVEAGWAMPSIIKRSAIVSHTPAPRPDVKVGDKVEIPGGGLAEVGMIDFGFAYLRPRIHGGPVYPFPLSEVETWERV